MDDERERRVEKLFAEALDVEASVRDAWLAERASSEPELVREVASLLAHHAAGVRRFATAEADLPERIGAYRILRLLGEGGMGVVYLAEQESPRRAVALKVIRPGFSGPSAVQRFTHEAQWLARLRHKGIAQIYESGVAETSAGPQPYFAMEYVEGESLSSCVARRAPSTRERLALLVQICDAVEHAHRRGVIHRDLKPSNVLVDESSGELQIKVLDFGVARAADGEVRATALRTGIGQMIGTLPYMSPEQASGDPEELDERADVYALGVIGYELLCGALPLELTDKPLPQALRMLAEVEPASLARVDSRWRGDLSTIFAKALEKNPERRYSTPRDLADDIGRFLAVQPLAARPPSRLYVLSKFTRRHRTLVVALAAVLIALTLGLVGTTRQSVRAAEQRDRADREARRVRAVADFQRSILSRVRPDLAGRDIKLADVLDATAASLPGELEGDPAVEAGVREMLGESFHALGLPAEAEVQFRAALALYERALGRTSLEALETRNWLAAALYDLGRVDEAESLSESVLVDAVAELGADHMTELVAELTLASIASYRGRGVEAESRARTALERRSRVLGDDHVRTLEARSSLGQFLFQQGRLAEAEAVLREAYAQGVALRGERHRSSIVQLNHLAQCARARGALAEAEQLFRRAMDLGTDLLGAEHVDTLTWINNLAAELERAKRYDEAEPLYRHVLDVRLHKLGEEHRDTLIVMNNLGQLLLGQGRYDDAEPLLRRALEVKQRVFGREHGETLAPSFNLGLMYILRGEYERALEPLRAAAENAPCALTPGHWKIGQFVEGYGAALMHCKRLDEAEPVLLRALEHLRDALADSDPRVVAVAQRLVDLYRQRGEPERADEIATRFELSVD
jgi:serine/threonine protein kinase/tetratricopeptide (TPR) repeat protein